MTQQADASLSLLKALHLPAPIANWPIAPGWIFLEILCLLAIIIGIYYSTKHWIRSRAKRLAFKKLTQLEKDYQTNKNAHLAVQEISVLLRRVALVYFPRKQVAGLFGKTWIEFLKQTTPEKYFDRTTVELLVTASYQKNSTVNIEPLLKFSRHWIEAC